MFVGARVLAVMSVVGLIAGCVSPRSGGLSRGADGAADQDADDGNRVDARGRDAPVTGAPDGPMENMPCTGPASQACGKCGTQMRTCQGGQWSAWSACAGEGV